MSFKIESTKGFLESRGIDIASSNTWLRNCVEWFIGENLNANLSELHSFVYDQFLLADLKDVQLDCLPPDILVREKIVLSGKYTLQVDSIQDVSQSCYSQIQKIRGTGKNLNVENQDMRQRNNAEIDIMKSDHMLKLNMTDGIQEIYGMEYEKLSSIRSGFIPGCKVVIKGPLECRLGVMLLKPQHLNLLGGELDSIIITNSVENVLARILNLEENPNALPINVVNDPVSSQTMNVPMTALVSDTFVQPSNVSNVQSNQTYARSNNESNTAPSNTTRSWNQLLTQSTTSTTEASSRDEIDWPDDDDDDVWNGIDTTLANLQPNSNINSRPIEVNHFSKPNCMDSVMVEDHTNHSENRLSDRNVTTSNNHGSLINNYKRLPSPDLIPPAKRINCHILNTFATTSENSPTSSNVKYNQSTPLRISTPFQTTLSQLSSPNGCIEKSSPPATTENSPSKSAKNSKITLAYIKETQPTLPCCMLVPDCKVETINKLKISKGCWNLPGIISDGTDLLSVVFSDKVISIIAGTSAIEVQSRKKEVTTDPTLKKSVEKLIEKITTHITKYEGSMTISFTPTQLPSIIELQAKK